MNQKTLSLLITQEGATQTAAAVDRVTAAGTKAEAAVKGLNTATGNMGQAAQRGAAEQERVLRASAASQRILAEQKGREQAKAMFDAMSAQFQRDQARVREDQARGLLTAAQAREAGRLNGVAYNQGILQAIDQGNAANAFRGSAGGGQLAQMANSLKLVDAAATPAARSLTGVRSAMTTVAAQALATAPGVAQLGGILGSFALGSGLMIGVLAGLAALGYAWHKLTEDSRKAKEETRKIVDEMLRMTREMKLGAAGIMSENITVIRSEIARVGGDLMQLKLLQEGGGFVSNKKIAETEQQFLKLIEAASFGHQKILEIEKDAAEKLRTEQDQANRKAEQARADALRKLKEALEAEAEEYRRQRNLILWISRGSSGDQLTRSIQGSWPIVVDPSRIGHGDPKHDTGDYAEAARLRAAQEALATAAAKRQADAWKAIWEEAVRGVQRAMADGFVRIFAEGLTGFRSFAESVIALFRNVAAQIASAFVASKLGLDKVLADIQAGTFKASSLPASVRYGGGAVIGAAAGYQSGSPAGGFAAGAASGAALGGVWGGVIGGLAGFVGGLLGAAKALRDMEAATKRQMDALRARVSGDPLEMEIAALKAQRQAEVSALAAPKDLDPKRMEEWRRNILEIQKSYDILIQRAKDAAAEQLKAAEEEKKAREAAIALQNRQAQQDYLMRQLVAEGRTIEADLLRQQIEYQAAVEAGLNDATLAALRLAQAAEAAAASAAIAAAQSQRALEAARASEDLDVRRLRATGQGGAADDLAFAQGQRREMEDAADRGKIYQRELGITQAVERQAREQEKANAALIAAVEAATAAEQARLEEQITLARGALDALRDQTRAQEQIVAETRRVVESLKAFSAGLSLDTSLTVLSPVQQMFEARKQYENLLRLAQGGDRSAAGQLPDAARRFLESSRGVNASGPAYVNDFLRVQRAIAEITDRFGVQLTVEEQMLVQLQQQTAQLNAQIAHLQQLQTWASLQLAEAKNGNALLRSLPLDIGHVIDDAMQGGIDLNRTGGAASTGVATKEVLVALGQIRDQIREMMGGGNLLGIERANTAIATDGFLRVVSRLENVVAAVEDGTLKSTRAIEGLTL